MATTLANLKERVNAELENAPMIGGSSIDVEAGSQQWYIAPPGFFVLDTPAPTMELDGSNVSITVDPTTGIATAAAPQTAGTGVFNFMYVSWTDDIIGQAINATIQNLFPSFYVAGVQDETPDGSTYEFDLDVGVEFCTGVETRTSTTDGWSRKRKARYTIFTDGDHNVIRFYTAPESGYMRLHTISRPVALASDSDDLSDAGLPERAADPIVSGSVYYLLLQKSAPRIRSDVAVATMGTGTVFPTMMAQVAQSWLMRYQFQLASMKMPPWSGR